MKRVLLVESHAAFRQSIALLLAPRLDCANMQAGTTEEARRILAESEGKTCLAIVDLDLPDGAAVELIAELRDTLEDVAVLAYTNDRNSPAQVRAFRAGADEVLTLHLPARHLLDTAVHLGEVTRGRQSQQA